MPTVIDSLVVELGLDPSKFTKGQGEAIDSLRKMEGEAKKRGAEVERAASGIEQGFSAVQKRLMGVAALLLGGLGIEQFIQKMTKLQVATANLGQVLGISSGSLQAWAGAAERFGVQGSAAQQGLATIQGQRFSLLNGNPGGSPLLNMARGTWGSANPMNINPGMEPEQQAMEIAKWLERSPRKAQDAAALTQLGGLSQDFVSMLMKGSKELERVLKESRSIAPTEQEIQRFKELNDSFEHASQMAKRLGAALTAMIAPELTKFFEDLAKRLEGTSHVIDRIVAGDKQGAQMEAQLLGDTNRKKQIDAFVDKLKSRGATVPEGTLQEQKRLAEEIARLTEELKKHRPEGGYNPTGMIGGFGAGGDNARLIQTAFSGGGPAAGGGVPGVGRNAFGGTRSNMGGDGIAVPDSALSGVTGNAFLSAQRSGIKAEIERDPTLRNQLAGMMSLEGTPLQSMESLANRTVATNAFRKSRGLPPLSVKQMLHSGFYGPINRGALPGAVAGLQRNSGRMKQMQDAIDSVLAGSNTVQGATDQGMITDPNGRHVGSDGFRLKGRGNVFNDWGGGGGHQFNERWRQDTQRRLRENSGVGAIPVPPPDPRGKGWGDSLLNAQRSSMFAGAAKDGGQSFQIGDIHIHKPVGDAEDLASNVKGNVRRIAQIMSANYGMA